jgi:uncharacterized protein YkwD
MRGRLPLTALLGALLAALALSAPAGATTSLTTSERSFLREINRVRAEYGLERLRADGHLERAARAHSREMLASNTFGHGDFDGRMAEFGLSGALVGENLAWGTGVLGSAHSIVRAWLASAEHRANLLEASYRRIGIGAVVGTFLGHRRARVVTADFAG